MSILPLHAPAPCDLVSRSKCGSLFTEACWETEEVICSCKAHDALTEKMLGKYDKLQYLKILNKGNLKQTSPFNVIGICL